MTQGELLEALEEYFGMSSALVIQLRRMNDRLDSMDRGGR